MTPNIDPTTLTWCQYCGCRHRIAWMEWRDDKYICRICCREPTPEEVRAKAELDRKLAETFALLARMDADRAKSSAEIG